MHTTTVAQALPCCIDSTLCLDMGFSCTFVESMSSLSPRTKLARSLLLPSVEPFHIHGSATPQFRVKNRDGILEWRFQEQPNREQFDRLMRLTCFGFPCQLLAAGVATVSDSSSDAIQNAVHHLAAGQSERNSYWGAEARLKRSERRWGFGGLPPPPRKNSSRSHPLDRWKMPHFCIICR